VAVLFFDLLAFVAAFTAAHATQSAPPVGWLTEPYMMLGLGVLCAAVVFAGCGLYRPQVIASGWFVLARSVRGWTILLAVALVGAASGWGQLTPFSSAVFFTLGVSLAGLHRVFLWRGWLRRRYDRVLRGARVIVGTGELAQRVARAAAGTGWGPDLVGFVDEVPDSGYRQAQLDRLPGPFLGGLDQVRELARDKRISHVLVAREDLSRGRLVELAHEWLDESLQVSLVSSAFEVMVARASGALLGGVPLAELQRSPQRGWRLRFKRILDVAAVSLGGLILLPLLLLIAALIKITSKGPVLFKQDRLGLRGRKFKLYKFRSMHADTDDRAHREYVEALIKGTLPEGESGEQKVYKIVNDPRITPLGRFLRASSLDEFPQLWNVLRGEMSLVGPRPCLPYEWELYQDWQRSRLEVLPGITGLWQVCGRSQVPFEEMVLLDLHYIANWSLSLDLTLLARTIPVVLRRSGGH
jgi:exopolysaccharide biosynthesis polyprenyl glycosylphosphotransferase